MNGASFIFQGIRVTIGFVLALIAAGLFLAWGFLQAGRPGDDPVAFAAMIGTGLVASSVIGAAVFVPAFVAIAGAELFRLRGFVIHVAAGGAIAFLVWTLGDHAHNEPRPGTTVALAAGFLAGAVYWLIAGRHSGKWRRNSQIHQQDG